MTNRRRIGIALAAMVALLIAVGIGRSAWRRAQEPQYEGRTASEWLDYVTADISPMDGFPSELRLQETTVAFEALGNDAKRLLIEEVVLFNEPTPLREYLYLKAENMPLLLNIGFFRSPAAHFRTCLDLIEQLRPSWECFEPVLTQAEASDNTNHIRSALLMLRYTGSGASNAVSFLTDSLRSTNQNAHIPSLAALYFHGTNADPALPVLLAKLDSPDWQLLSKPGWVANLINVLGNIGVPAKSAVPRLERILEDTGDAERRIEAGLALTRMEPYHDKAVSLLSDSLTNRIGPQGSSNMVRDSSLVRSIGRLPAIDPPTAGFSKVVELALSDSRLEVHEVALFLRHNEYLARMALYAQLGELKGSIETLALEALLKFDPYDEVALGRIRTNLTTHDSDWQTYPDAWASSLRHCLPDSPGVVELLKSIQPAPDDEALRKAIRETLRHIELNGKLKELRERDAAAIR